MATHYSLCAKDIWGMQDQPHVQEHELQVMMMTVTMREVLVRCWRPIRDAGLVPTVAVCIVLLCRIHSPVLNALTWTCWSKNWCAVHWTWGYAEHCNSNPASPPRSPSPTQHRLEQDICTLSEATTTKYSIHPYATTAVARPISIVSSTISSAALISSTISMWLSTISVRRHEKSQAWGRSSPPPR